jgi:hypothetical protein
MRVTDIEVNSGDNRVLELNLQSPRPTDRYTVKGIFGLDAEEIVPRFYGCSVCGTHDYVRMSMPDREIVIHLALRPSWSSGETYSDLRDQLYRGISMSRDGELELVFKAAGTSVAYIKGTISKFEAPLSNPDAELQITLNCRDPFLRSVGQISFLDTDFGTDGYLHFADAMSTAPHGAFFLISFLQDASSLVIQDDDPYKWKFEVVPDTDFLAGDTLHIRTDVLDREVTWYHNGGGSTSLIDRISPGSFWPVIYPGPNQLYLPGIVSGDILAPDVTFSYVYWGV